METVSYTFVRNGQTSSVTVEAKVLEGDPSREDSTLLLSAVTVPGTDEREVRGVRHCKARHNRPPYWALPSEKPEADDEPDPAARGGSGRRKAKKATRGGAASSD